MSDPISREHYAVLFVDDEENILSSIERIFFDEEYTVITASSGEKGLEELALTDNIAVIVSDQRMPGMSGAEFLERAREVRPDAVRMVLTGYADVNAAMDAINKGGASRYLSKPWDENSLLQAVRDGIDYYAMLLENRRLNELIKEKNEELAQWNSNLKNRVMDQTSVIRKQNEELSSRNARIQSSFNGIIEAFSRLFELASPKLRNHSRNVAELAVAMAKQLGLTETEINQIKIASLLHDIGVIGLPENILAKRPVDMTNEEKRLYQQHSVRGQSAIDAVEDLRETALLIRNHHEHYNGNGFPDRLVKEEIPLGSRIIGFANYIDREMGEAKSSEALEQMFTRATLQLGLMLDPMLVSVAKKVAKYVYYEGFKAASGVENEYPPTELVTGMLVTRDVYTGTGLLLIKKGATLDRQMIESVQRYYTIDPPARGVYAMIKGQPA